MKIAAFVLVFLVAISGVYALSAALEQSKLIVHPEVGDTLVKTLAIHNKNSYPVALKVTTVDDPDVSLEIIDSVISLVPDEENNILFTLTATKAGTHNVKVCTQWSAPAQSNVGVCSTITVVATDNGFDALKSSVDSLESWKEGVDSQLDNFKAWLSYSQFGNVCDAVANKCDSQSTPTIRCRRDSDCGNSGFVEQPFCAANLVYQRYKSFSCNLAATSMSYCSSDKENKLVEDCPDYCSEGKCAECITSDECEEGKDCRNNKCQLPYLCTFRTNAINGNYVAGTWIAVDANNDQKLEGFGYASTSGILANCAGTLITRTPEGYPVMLKDNKVMVCVGSTGKWVEKHFFGASIEAITDSGSLEPFSSNHQEVC